MLTALESSSRLINPRSGALVGGGKVVLDGAALGTREDDCRSHSSGGL